MIIEARTYTLKIGKVADYLALYRAEGLEPQRRHLGQPYGYYSTETGALNQIVHLWAYADANDRAAKRAALYADREWQAVVPKLFELIERMESAILNPAFFVEPQACKIVA
ncbi:NIPSNAP family protein [Sphingomonas sp. MG17]|uniref:NIPSNAP family protein n=1 Tax=Sphingomonas tagetis TaxID=2949092 RepID=A0A9X2HJZ2_9SPHN|nr:NIPSNAP family protein [Sphingomonas tagetis]MCP3732616.1 NIPSNAP family protein [Sphingomonas tagetis]